MNLSTLLLFLDFNNIVCFIMTEDTIKEEPKDPEYHKDPTTEWLSPVPEVEVGSTSNEGPHVRARKVIPRGARFGPFLGKWASDPYNPRYAWEVSH